MTDYRGGNIRLEDSNYKYSLNTKFSSNEKSITSYFLNVENGSYSLRLNFYGDSGNEEYVYTGGQTFEQLGIASESDLYSKLPKYNISSGTTITINFNQFKRAPKPYEWYSNYKTIIITYSGNLNGYGQLYLIDSYSNRHNSIYSSSSSNGGSSTFNSYWVDDQYYPGSYYLYLNIEYYDGSSWTNEKYVYTNGHTLASLGINSGDDLYSKLPQFTIPSMPDTTTIDFSKFVKIPDSWLP